MYIADVPLIMLFHWFRNMQGRREEAEEGEGGVFHRIRRQYWLAFLDKERLRFSPLPSTKNFRSSIPLKFFETIM